MFEILLSAIAMIAGSFGLGWELSRRHYLTSVGDDMGVELGELMSDVGDVLDRLEKLEGMLK